jgi:streptomycin 6-kinase
MIDPKPFIGDPAFDAVQHVLNCDARLATDPNGLAQRMAGLLDFDQRRLRLPGRAGGACCAEPRPVSIGAAI